MAITLSESLSHTLVKRILALFALFGVPIVAFVGLANEVKETNPVPGDLAILHGLHALSSPFMDALFVTLTTLGSAPVVIAIVLLILVYLVRHKHHRDALFVLAAAGGAALLNVFFKVLFHRARPSLWQQIVTEKGYSFPSGHAMISCSLALTIIILCWPTRWRRLAIIGGSVYFVLVGISRLYLGVHYPSDVVGGWLVSVAWIYLIHRAFGAFSPTKQKETEDQPIEVSAATPAHK
ncbi:MAG: phosphatase PAP2 family protein [Candidatus Saccharimonadales bacterium]